MIKMGTLIAVIFVGTSIYVGVLLKHSVMTGARLFSHENVQGSLWLSVILLSAYLIAVTVVFRKK
jgi:hypothetical protein